jgi:hypothetical protein
MRPQTTIMATVTLMAALVAVAMVPAMADPAAPASSVAASQSACVAKGMNNEWKLAGTDSARQMVRACLIESPPSADLCEKLPVQGQNDVMGIEAWYIKGCSVLGLTSGHCHALMDEVAEHCYAGGNG